MKYYLVNYSIPGMMTFAPLYARVLALNEDDACRIVKEQNQTWEIHTAFEDPDQVLPINYYEMHYFGK